MDDPVDLLDLAEEVLDIEAFERMDVVFVVELDRPSSEVSSVSGRQLAWVSTGSTGVAGISLTWGWGTWLVVTRELGRGEASLAWHTDTLLLGRLSPLPHAMNRRIYKTHLKTYSGPVEFSLEHLEGDPGASPGCSLDSEAPPGQGG